MFLIILLLVYFDYMLSIVRLELCLCIGSYNTCSLGQWVSGRCCVGEVPRPYLSTITPSSDCEVDHRSDSPVESSIVLLPIIRIVEHHYYREVIAMFMIFLCNITMYKYNLFL